MEGIIEVVGILVAGGGLKHLFDYLREKRRLKAVSKTDAFKKIFDDIHKVYTCLNHLAFHCGAKRVVIVKVEDGGGVPTVNSHLRSTILYEVFEPPLTMTKTHWQNVKVGKVYLEYVKEIYEKGKSRVVVDELEASELRDLHCEHNTKMIVSFFMVKSQRYFLYLSIQFDRTDVELGPEGRNSLRINKEKLKKIFTMEDNSTILFEEKEEQQRELEE